MISTATSALPNEKPACFSPVLHKYCENSTNKRSKIFYTDEAVIAGLKAQDAAIIKYVYEHSFFQIKFLVTSNSGNKMDAEDLFQDVLMVIYKKISTENLKLTSSFNTYLFAICKHLWLQRLNKRIFTYEFKEIAGLEEWQDDNNIEELMEESEKYSLFQQHFLKLNTDDQKVLKLYMNKTSLKEIAHIMGYKSGDYAKFRKYICKEKLKNAILNDPLFKRITQSDYFAPALSN